MKVIKNPENGAPIRDFLYQKRLYDLSVDEKKLFEDEVAQELLTTYPFLEEVNLEGEFKCQYGDFASDTKVAVIGHERSHKEAPTTEKGKEFITPQEKVDAEKEGLYDMLPAEGQTDQDGIEWTGKGLEEDNELRPLSLRKPGVFT
jgi:hypothetical protein